MDREHSVAEADDDGWKHVGLQASLALSSREYSRCSIV